MKIYVVSNDRVDREMADDGESLADIKGTFSTFDLAVARIRAKLKAEDDEYIDEVGKEDVDEDDLASPKLEAAVAARDVNFDSLEFEANGMLWSISPTELDGG